ncbi:ATP-binding protein [Streptomyces sp. NBC_01198]|uniref:ATP-binding protein n=1 Tax=Streptomyces sp. NBC_01198 TaxID=2903769 RepID=UPI002E0FEEF9|nr:ATP-binding protein [Streptomyces sp. NBC_01198]
MATTAHPYTPAQILWPATPRGVHQARHSLERRLAEWGRPDLAPVAGLVLTELMTNACQHAAVEGRRTGVSVLPVPGGVRIEVHDPADLAAGEPTVRAAPPEDERGRGLALVDTLTGHRWGVTDRDGPGKVVWAVCADPES